MDSPTDWTADADGAERWVSFEELARARGISKASAGKLVRRRRWRRQRDNQGRVRILVPVAWVTPEGVRETDSPADSPADRTADISRISSAFEAAIAALTERALVAEEGRTRAEAARDIALAQLRTAEELLKEAQIERAVNAAMRRSWLFRRLWRGRGG